MKDQKMLYTGQLNYKEIEFIFIFDGNELRLIPPKDKQREIEEQWFGTPVATGVYIPNIPIVEESHLSGFCNESGRKMVFLTKRGSYISIYGNHLLGHSFVWPDRKFCVKAGKQQSEKQEQIKGWPVRDTAWHNRAYPPMFRDEGRYARVA